MKNQIAYEVHYRYRKHSDFANELALDLEAIGLPVSQVKFNDQVRKCRVLVKVINEWEPFLSDELESVIDAFDREIRDHMGGVLVYWENPNYFKA